MLRVNIFIILKSQKKKYPRNEQINKNKMSAVIECRKSEDFQKLIAQGKSIVDFSATWCKRKRKFENSQHQIH